MNNMQEDQIQSLLDAVNSTRDLNESAVRGHALKCSAEIKGGKFQRVGREFLDEVRADVEAVRRQLRNMYPVADGYPQVEADANANFVTGHFMDTRRNEMDALVARLIQHKVKRHPSQGKTLLRTR